MSKLCSHANPIGYVSNQPDDYDHDKPLASRVVCHRSVCLENTKAWVEKETNMTGQFREFKKAATS